jgi:indole-3-glycerol phosphate synthase
MPAEHIRRDPESQADLLAHASEPAPGLTGPTARATPDLRGAASRPAATRSLAEALRRAAREGGVGLIAELKRRSPSAGTLREDLDPAELAGIYAGAGAAAVSVLTETSRFGGSLADLERAAHAVDIPVLRKDFLTHPLQVRESREAGADAVLLIVRLLDPGRLVEMLGAVAQAGLEALVEARTVEELRLALRSGAGIVGINNRDLSTLCTDVSHSLDVAREARRQGLPWPELAVSESGIRTRAEVLEVGRAGYGAVLVGESLLRAGDPARAVRRLLGSP